MHERNVYKSPPDFAKLAEQYQEFAKFVTISSDGRGHINFKDAEALRELTCTLLQHDFGLTLDIPLDRLIPTVPLRLNYILWIEDLISGVEKDGRNVKGLDIGERVGQSQYTVFLTEMPSHITKYCNTRVFQRINSQANLMKILNIKLHCILSIN